MERGDGACAHSLAYSHTSTHGNALAPRASRGESQRANANLFGAETQRDWRPPNERMPISARRGAGRQANKYNCSFNHYKSSPTKRARPRLALGGPFAPKQSGGVKKICCPIVFALRAGRPADFVGKLAANARSCWPPTGACVAPTIASDGGRLRAHWLVCARRSISRSAGH